MKSLTVVGLFLGLILALLAWVPMAVWNKLVPPKHGYKEFTGVDRGMG